MMKFKDYYGNIVHLSFEEYPFSKTPKHVWVISRYKNQWLLTKHKKRGLEFPGGKVEEGESVEEAAFREVWEETGAFISELLYIGQYKVERKTDTIIKNIYFAHISSIQKRATYYETEGPFLISELPNDMRMNNHFSFIMKDQVLTESLKVVSKFL